MVLSTKHREESSASKSQSMGGTHTMARGHFVSYV